MSSDFVAGDADKAIRSLDREFMASEAQHQFLAQTALLMKSLSRLLPFAAKHRHDPD